jgi:tight adherence protein B
MLMTVLIGLFGFLTIAGLGLAFAGGGGSTKAVKRAQAVAGTAKAGERVKLARKTASDNSPDARRKQLLAQLKESERKDRKARVSIAAKIRQADLTLSVRDFYVASAIVGLVVIAAALVLQRPIWMAAGFGFAAAFGLPRWIVGHVAKGRQKKFTQHFADAMDVIVRGIRSGLPMHDCLKIIARESPAPVGPEFQRLVENLAMGLTMEQAMDKMFDRMPTPEVRFFSIVLAIQSKAGGNLGEALGNLSAVLRARKLMKEKIKALSGEAVASAGIIGSLPPLLLAIVSFTSPGYISIMFTDQRGQMMLLLGGVLMATGVFVMKRMISFKF